MTTFYLVRHGTKEAIMGDPHLSELGRKQAELTGQLFKTKDVSAIFSSPLLRTQQTAQIIGKELGLFIAMDERLKERMNWGDKKEESFEEFIMEWEKASKDRQYQPPHGDSAWNTGERLKKFLLEKASIQADQNILVVTHGGTIGDFLLNMFDNLDLVSSTTGATYVKIFECSVTTIEIKDDKFVLKNVGDISHLPEVIL